MAVQDPAVHAQPGAAPASSGRHAARPSPGAAAALRQLWSWASVPFWIAATRIALGVIFAHLVIVLLPQARQHIVGATLNNGTWLGAFDRWDSAYYLDIAQHGYPAHPVGLAQHTAFFPGYSLLVALVHGITLSTVNDLHAALAVSWLAFIGASVLLYRLADRLLRPEGGAHRHRLVLLVPGLVLLLGPILRSPLRL